MPVINTAFEQVPFKKDSDKDWRGQYSGVIGLFTLLVFTWLPNSYSGMVAWPYALLWQGALLILMAWAVWMCRQFSIELRPLGHSLDGPVIMLVIASIFSSLNASFIVVAFWNLSLLSSYAVILYLLTNWLRQGKLNCYQLWCGLSGVGTITSIISLLHWRPNATMLLSTNFHEAIRNPAPLGHHNFVGGYELLVLPIILSFALTQIGWRKYCWLGAAGTAALALYASGSRGALLGLITILFTLIPISFLYFRKRGLLKRWLVSVLCLTVILLLIVAGNPRIRTLIQTPVSSYNSTEVSIDTLDDGPVKDRLLMLQTTGHILKAHPFLGLGPGNLSRNYNLYRPLEAGSGLELVQQLHNMPAQIMAELGLIGISIYMIWLGCLLRLGLLLQKKATDKRDRLLLYGIGFSWLGYSVSSLTDYQLENIGIATNLLVSTALFIQIADTYDARKQNKPFPRRLRRVLSLILLFFCCFNCQLWARADAGFLLTHLAQNDLKEYDFVGADNKWYKANQLVPWDPTYPMLAAERLFELIDNTNSEDIKDALTGDAIHYLEKSLKAAPYDSWLNQNLAVFQLPNDAQIAEKYISRAILLYPRHTNYSYYILGLSYLQQGKRDKAVVALALESIAHSDFLFTDIWDREPFSTLQSDVVKATIDAYNKILTRTNNNLNQYTWLNNQIAVLNWWFNYPSQLVDTERISPLTQAILKIDSDPKIALELINQQLLEDSENKGLLLLRAWLSPDQYLNEFFIQSEGTQEEKDTIEINIRTHRDIQSWLSSVSTSPPKIYRQSVGFAYRNASANAIRDVLYPKNFKVNFLIDLLNLLPRPAREFTELDYQMDSMRTQSLDLVIPRKNKFELPSV